jgi:hypothetical protein
MGKSQTLSGLFRPFSRECLTQTVQYLATLQYVPGGGAPMAGAALSWPADRVATPTQDPSVLLHMSQFGGCFPPRAEEVPLPDSKQIISLTSPLGTVLAGGRRRVLVLKCIVNSWHSIMEAHGEDQEEAGAEAGEVMEGAGGACHLACCCLVLFTQFCVTDILHRYDAYLHG